MTRLDTHTPNGRLLLTAVAQIFDQISPDDQIVSVLVGTVSPDEEEIHYYVVRGSPEVRRMLMRPDTPEAAQARALLAQTSIRLDAPDTPPDDTPL